MIVVSIVSHGHGSMVVSLIEQLLIFSEVGKIIVTLNIEDDFSLQENEKIKILKNKHPKGFGENHNAAFEYCQEDFFCPLNPDITFQGNPFPDLLAIMIYEKYGMAAPRVNSPNGQHEDSWRHFPTILSLTKKILGISDGRYSLPVDEKPFSPDWVAGMFMLFRSESFRKIGGFDEGFFLYYEDADICTRLSRSNIPIIACPSVSVFHDARRDSRRKLSHLYWHLCSMIRYFKKHWRN